MIAPKIVAEVRRLLEEKTHSQRKIARLVGVSRGTVGTIALGRRPDYDLRRSLCEDEGDEPDSPPERCPGCGGMVQMPCRLCRVREQIARNPRAASHGPIDCALTPLGLNLRPDHYARYEQVRAWRREQEALESHHA